MTDGTDRMDRAYGLVDGEAVLRCVGRQVKALRKRSGLTQAELGPRIGYSVHMVASVETGVRVPRPDFLRASDGVLGSDGVLAAAVEVVEEVRAARLYRGGHDGQPSLTAWHAYAPAAVPEPLRTEDYARAVLHAARPPLDDGTVEREAAAQAAAGELLERQPPPLVTCVLEEAVLHRPYGGREVLCGQLGHLVELARRRHVEIQVMPTAVEGHPGGAEGGFTVLEPAGDRLTAVRAGDRIITRRAQARVWRQRYGALRARARTPAESLALLESLV
ncbi:transcriptional regulator [Streptomyces carminius]|uniref:Transcriptional regulator n=1 Tax=Streptomyces carminius TaxID=2665496 RepID=A0A2M8LWJ5_9ACTN|nr:helix-turn-helix transcriptional regulator [Streptomyces carminius]PJE96330.1 transcriptional regulator [Streptomyces carminius]